MSRKKPFMSTTKTGNMVEITAGKDLYGLRWVARALSKDPSRQILGVMLIHGDKAVATDGRRLHIYESDLIGSIPGGTYRVIQNSSRSMALKAESCGDYPNYAAVVPADMKTVSESWDLDQILFDIARAGTCVHVDYLKDVVTSKLKDHDKPSWVAQVSILDPHLNPIVVRSHLSGIRPNYLAVIMPKRIECTRCGGSGKAKGGES